MLKRFLLILLVVGLIFLSYFYFINQTTSQEKKTFEQANQSTEPTKVQDRYQKKEVQIGSKTYSLYLTKTAEERALGLAVFEDLPSNEGMLFSFDTEDNYVFWMKNMKFNIDMIFLDKDKRIIEIFENVKVQENVSDDQLETYYSHLKSQYVIELKAGEIRKNNLQVGDVVRY